MLIAHVPMGYLQGKWFSRYAKLPLKQVMLLSLLGNIAPDFDMFYFYVFDGRKTHHHDYVTHWPLFWIAVSSFLIAATYVLKRKNITLSLAFSIGTMSHMVMDSVAAPIHWLAPFSQANFELVHVPAISSNWIISFVSHWTFGIEIMICIYAFVLFLQSRRKVSFSAK
jgi:inner membrane protein